MLHSHLSVKSVLHHRLIVSVQAEGNEPLNTPEYLTALAETVMLSGVKFFRMAGCETIRYFKQKNPDTTIVGLTKHALLNENPWEKVYITPTFEDIEALYHAGASLIAVDGTTRDRPCGMPAETWLKEAKLRFPHIPLWADCATLEDIEMAYRCHMDVISTTLFGYTLETQSFAEKELPGFSLLQEARTLIPRESETMLILEGRVWEPWHIREAYERGADAVVVGSAITRPQLITQRFLVAG
ncbi:MAG: N-acetylmannosamine-6-phosphate 2-epimerase [Vampirovibrionales bacterium]